MAVSRILALIIGYEECTCGLRDAADRASVKSWPRTIASIGDDQTINPAFTDQFGVGE
jgi:hypothetical protein